MATTDTTENHFEQWFRAVGRALGDEHIDWDSFEALLVEHAPISMVDLHGPDHLYCGRCIEDGFLFLERQPYPCRTLKIVAAPFRTFDGYQQEWRI